MKVKLQSDRNFGHGDIAVLKNTVKLYTSDGELYEIALSDLPEYCKLPKVTGKRIQNATFSLNRDGSVLYNVHPWAGKYIAKFVRVQAKEGELPHWKIQPGGVRQRKDGGKFVADDKAVFGVICKIVQGDFEGTEFVKMFDYPFQADPDGKATIMGRTKGVTELVDGLRLFGLDVEELDLTYSENMLPKLEELILSVKPAPAFEADFKEGWATLSELPVGMYREQPARRAPAQAKEPAKPAAEKPARGRKPKAEDDDAPWEPPTR